MTTNIQKIERLTGTVTLRNTSSDFKNVLDQKDSNLCVPIAVSVLIRWAIKNDLKSNDRLMEDYFTVEIILTKLTMIIYPRSLAGLNLNPKNEERKFQQNEIELLLKRIKNETYLNHSGWRIISSDYFFASVSFDFDQGKKKYFFNFCYFISPSSHNLHAESSLDCHCCLHVSERRSYLPPNDPRPRRKRQICSPKHASFVRA